MTESAKRDSAKGPRASNGLDRLLEGLRRKPSGDSALVEACLRGDERAWEEIINRYKNLIFSIPLKYGGTREDAADVFQAVCMELFNELPRLRNTDNLRPWLMTVAAHQSFHWKRKRVRRSEKEVEGVNEEALDGAALTPEISAELEREQLLREAVARLPGRCQKMVRMLFFEEPPLPYAEVAARLGLARGSIGFVRGRCLKKLQQALEELGY